MIRDELLAALERCCRGLRETWLTGDFPGQGERGADAPPYDKLADMEETVYVPALVDILWNGEETRQERKLIRFSVISHVEKYLEERKRGIVFSKNQNLVIILKGMERQEAREFLCGMAVSMESAFGHRLGALVGPAAESMSQIPESYQRCLEWKGYLFFEDQLGVPVICAGSQVFQKKVDTQEFESCRSRLLEAMVTQNKESFDKCLKQFVRYVCIRSEGKKGKRSGF